MSRRGPVSWYRNSLQNGLLRAEQAPLSIDLIWLVTLAVFCPLERGHNNPSRINAIGWTVLLLLGTSPLCTIQGNLLQSCRDYLLLLVIFTFFIFCGHVDTFVIQPWQHTWFAADRIPKTVGSIRWPLTDYQLPLTAYMNMASDQCGAAYSDRGSYLIYTRIYLWSLY